MQWKFLFFLLLSGYASYSQGLFQANREERIVRMAAWNALTPAEKEEVAIRMAGQDSLIEARAIWNGLLESAPTPLPEHWLVRRDSLDTIIIRRLKDSFQGTWEWEWSGSNWGSSDSPLDCKCSRTLYIGDTTLLEIVQRGTTVDSNHYTHSLFSAETNNAPIYFEFSAESADSTERWAVKNIREAIKTGTSVNYLLLNKMAGCVCGCPEERYRRVTN